MNQKTLDSFNGDELASSTFLQKYAIKDENNQTKESTFEELKDRLANSIVDMEVTHFKLPIEKKSWFKTIIRKLLGEKNKTYFLPGGRISYALGNPYDNVSTFSNCYFTDIEEDSIEGIFETAKRIARIYSYGGGCGIDISKLRPNGLKVNNSAKTTSGAVSFMDLYSLTTSLIGQHGRRAALMISMDISHPDVLDFIKIKGGEDKSKCQYANISIKASDEFMNAVEKGEKYLTNFTNKDNSVYTKEIDAREIWNEFVKSNYNGGEPGIMFWTKMQNEPSVCFAETIVKGVNPCGEIPLQKGGSCLLGSINLIDFVNNRFLENAEFDIVLFEEKVKQAVRFLDDVLELNIERHPLEENKIAAKLARRIGLGITSLADCLITLNLKYDSEEAVNFIDKIMRVFRKATVESSIELAEERGECEILTKYRGKDEFENFVNHEYFSFLQTESPEYFEKLRNFGIRNLSLSTCAPNGSLSLILGSRSSGIEPIFRLSYERTKINNEGTKEKFVVYHNLAKEYNEIFGEGAHLKNPNFVTSDLIDWKMRIKVQSTLQKYITSSISSTCNLPSDVPIETISDIYFEAWKQGLKGLTIYRDKSREGVLNEVKTKKKKYDVLEETHFPDTIPAVMKTIKSEGRKWYIHYSLDEQTGLPNSLFVNTNSTESEILTNDLIERLEELAEKHIKNGHLQKLKEKHNGQKNVTKICRTLSLLLRHRVSILEIITCLESAQIPIYSFAFQIKKLLSTFIEGEPTGALCPDCKEELVYEAGCAGCKNCGWQKCS